MAPAGTAAAAELCKPVSLQPSPFHPTPPSTNIPREARLRLLLHWRDTMSSIAAKIVMPWVCLWWCCVNNHKDRLQGGSHEQSITTKIALRDDDCGSIVWSRQCTWTCKPLNGGKVRTSASIDLSKRCLLEHTVATIASKETRMIKATKWWYQSWWCLQEQTIKKIQRRWGSPEEKNTNNNQLADDCYHVFFNRNKDRVDDSSVRLKTQQSAKLASWLGEWLPWGPNDTTECLCAWGFCEMLQSLKKLDNQPHHHTFNNVGVSLSWLIIISLTIQ